MKDIKHDLAILDDKYQSYITIADSFDDEHMEQRNAWMNKAGFVARLINYVEAYKRILEDDGK